MNFVPLLLAGKGTNLSQETNEIILLALLSVVATTTSKQVIHKTDPGSSGMFLHTIRSVLPVKIVP